MAAESLSIREAWTQIPSPGSAETEIERFTSKRMERILATVVAIGSAVLGGWALFTALAALDDMHAGQLTILIVVFVPLLAMLVACAIGRAVRIASGTFAIAYVVALAAWPTVAAGDSADSQPWIFFLVNVSVVAALLAFPLRVQFAVGVAVPLVYGYVRLVQGGFAPAFWISTAFDVSFTLILGFVLISLGWMFRSVAAGVDDARGRAVASYASAAAAAAAEEERVAMSALMHDSVLAALIAAERAESDRAKELAVGMAREALTRLANTEAAVAQEGSDEPVAQTQVVVELRRALSELGVDAVVEERGGSGVIPGRVARALVLAARQAIGNAVTHAGGRGLHVVAEQEHDGIRVIVIDAGPGFDLEGIGEDRLGIRASILARMAGVAGTARIDSGDDGTVVTLEWMPS
ncbi:sensor histidine kinase [Microbacterium sp. 179-I 3D4 NHS]|uniref:sensor histidine kinase n=1 Tax=Microbacterium sp. 179-I 3D4 NHS TaxID=3142381 RepID=UPI0039A2D7E2